MNIKQAVSLAVFAVSAVTVNAATFVMEKNGTSFSIDGNGGAQEGQQLYLWGTNTNNVNQQWVQISHDNGYYSYKKYNTNLCWDGGSGGSRRQAVTLEVCDSSNYDQHWAKIKITSGTEIYRFEKRNAAGFSIDGNSGASERQSIYLWDSNSGNINQQWDLTRTDDSGITPPADDKLAIDTAFDDGSGHGSYPATNAIDGSTAWSTRWAGSGSPVNLTIQLEETSNVTEVGIAWGQGDSRSYTFEIYARPGTSGAWTKVFDDVSSGSNSGIEVFDITDISAQQIRIKTFSNTAGTSWTNINEVEIYGGEGTVIPPGDCDIADWDWSVWDLEGGDNDLDPVSGNSMVFDALAAKHVTPNGNGWRHELKIKEDERVAMTELYEDFSSNIKLNLSDGSKTIVAQHHASDTGTIMKLYVSDTSESGFDDSIANNGIFDVYVRLAKEDGSGEEKQALGTARTGDSFDFQVINDHGYVTVKAMGNTFALQIEDSSASYLKFGNYLQAQDAESGDDVEDSDDWADFYQDAGITNSKLTFSNVCYTRDVD